ncbi:hypothetical protein EV356DRAFT_509719 [Viridothelium virens]|uniref:Uncharacterized protein n=1 Tax=Viridothelium virens TaxID=1048519 RepID=A0A6A6HK39_VIRVR|nr:hypothetical protein EV356DRAFT_509719 [Viridothelium virens]
MYDEHACRISLRICPLSIKLFNAQILPGIYAMLITASLIWAQLSALRIYRSAPIYPSAPPDIGDRSDQSGLLPNYLLQLETRSQVENLQPH